MLYRITGECICCGVCAQECPVQAISRQGLCFAVDPARCIGCGDCASICPVGAPVPDQRKKPSVTD